MPPRAFTVQTRCVSWVRPRRGKGGLSSLRREPVLLLVAIAVGGLSCRGAAEPATTESKSAVAQGPIPADSDRFPHDLHTGDDPRIQSYKNRGLACTDCHPEEAVVEGELARPGLDAHSPCDECHKDEFYKPPGKFCKNCHTDVNPRKKGATEMQPYPERGLRKVLASEFSHRLHLDRDAMEAAVGFHVSCKDCHERDEQNEPELPGHAACARCHAEQDKPRSKLAMNECGACHPQRDITLKRGRIFITGDLVFSHGDHVEDQAGQPIKCDLCHADIPGSRSAKDASVPTMQRCAICHEDSQRTPERVRIARCETCHTKIDSSSPPESHLVGKGLPENHTLEFRRNHGEQAADPDANCRFCHENLSGKPKDTCYQCHQTMRPRDHGIAWRDDAHGREASADRDRCATCHEADYCVACHSVPPRSHQPFAAFRLGGHAQAARFDLRSCFACHTYQDTCSNCHRGVR